MTIRKLAVKLNINPNLAEDKASALFLTQELRLAESELLKIAGAFGVSTVEELDKKIAAGKISEEKALEDFYRFDYLVERKKELEKLLQTGGKKIKPNLWESIKNSAALPKWNLVTS
ncbi:MAG: hypothetical protein M1120_02420 [Patescibacteria group bacterium]|nr:hypothetical protein [Patescibacteria group bacterium]